MSDALEKRFSTINFAMPDPPMENDENEEDGTPENDPPNQEFKAFKGY